jgi:hypothetical protein
LALREIGGVILTKSICFLFGAGAESFKMPCGKKLPSGFEFLLKTLVDIDITMLDALDSFYRRSGVIKNINSLKQSTIGEVWSDEYRKDHIFSNYGTSGYRVIKKTIEILQHNNKIGNKYNECCCNAFLSAPNDSKKACVDLFIRPTEDAVNKGKKLGYFLPTDLRQLVTDNMTTFGEVEAYFHTVINPKRYGQNKFWKLVNFYWAAFFSILVPLIPPSSKYYEEVTGNSFGEKFYIKILDNLSEVFENLYDSDHNTLSCIDSADFYYDFEQFYDNDYDIKGVITTNYTRFIERTKQNVAYINGRLDRFELPFTREVKSVTELKKSDFVFPFIFPQTAIKPIVCGYQIEEFNKAYKIMTESKNLVIIGYNVNEDDNHLNSLLTQFIKGDSEKRIIYCRYLSDDKQDDLASVFEKKCYKLRFFSEEDRKRFIIIDNKKGEGKQILFSKIMQII